MEAPDVLEETLTEGVLCRVALPPSLADGSDSVAVSIIRADPANIVGCALMMDTATPSETSAKEGGSEIKKFFKGSCVLVTGATGFLGKVLLEKLLRSCSDVEIIYVLLRGKKGKHIQERMKALLNDQVFETLPGQWRGKLQAVEGELGVPDLGMTQETRDLLTSTVNIVMHCAATVRFDEPLKRAIKVNVKGTADIITLCKKMNNLKSMVYVSTAFSHCERMELGTNEEFYPPGISPKTALALADYENDDVVNMLTPRLLMGWPNTYTFTKAIAEEVMRLEASGLPAAVFRPGIVVGTSGDSAVPGFVDNLYGPTGFVVGIGYGVIKATFAKEEFPAQLVPADLCINGMIAAAWKVGTNKYEEPPIYNFTPSTENYCIWSSLLKVGLEYGHTVPLPDCMWYNFIYITNSMFKYKLLWFFLHFIPALILDTFLLATGNKPKMVNAHKKIDKFLDALQFFGLVNWSFGQDNVKQLLESMSPRDQEEFYMDMKAVNWNEYMKTMLDGIRLYLLKQKPDNIPECRTRYNRLKMIHYAVKYALIALALYSIWTILACCPWVRIQENDLLQKIF